MIKKEEIKKEIREIKLEINRLENTMKEKEEIERLQQLKKRVKIIEKALIKQKILNGA
jgi:hypothetical protein